MPLTPVDLDDVTLLSDNDSQGSDYNPTKRSQHCFDLLKFMGVILYQLSLCLTVGYYFTSNFASIYLMGMFKGLIVLRPILIVIYSVMSSLLEFHKVHHARETLKKRMDQEIIQFEEDKQKEKLKKFGLDSDSNEEDEVPADDSKQRAKVPDDRLA